MTNIFDKIISDISKDIARDKKIEELIYEKVKTLEIPILVHRLYGRGSRIEYTVAINKSIWLNKSNGSYQWIYGSTGTRLKYGLVRIATKNLQKKLLDIDDKIYELQKQKQELMKQEWSKCKKLSWQKAVDFDNLKKELYKED